jgi:VanZ family protein
MILTFTFALIICVGTLTPLPQAVDVPGTDKWHHFLAFAALTYPITAASRRHWLLIIAFGLSFGAVSEIIQPYVNRFGDIADFTADAIGVLIGFSHGAIGYFLKLKNDNSVCLPKQ